MVIVGDFHVVWLNNLETLLLVMKFCCFFSGCASEYEMYGIEVRTFGFILIPLTWFRCMYSWFQKSLSHDHFNRHQSSTGNMISAPQELLTCAVRPEYQSKKILLTASCGNYFFAVGQMQGTNKIGFSGKNKQTNMCDILHLLWLSSKHLWQCSQVTL